MPIDIFKHCIIQPTFSYSTKNMIAMTSSQSPSLL